MKPSAAVLATLILIAGATIFAQEKKGGEQPHFTPSKPPAHGPAPARIAPAHNAPEHNAPAPQQHFADKSGHPEAPHVDGKTWAGHDTGDRKSTRLNSSHLG